MLGSLLLSPLNGLTFVFGKIVEAVEEAREAERNAIMAELRDLHRRLEQGSIDEARFDERENELLTRLDRLNGKLA